MVESLLLVFAIVGSLFGGYAILGVLASWPRILASRQMSGREPQAVQARARVYMSVQVVLFLAALLVARLHSAAAFNQLFRIAAVAGCTLMALDLFVYYLFPTATGVTLIGPPPRMLLRELGEAWVRPVVWLPAIGLFLALFVGAHILGAAVLVLGIIVITGNRGHRRRVFPPALVPTLVEGTKAQSQRRRLVNLLWLADTAGPEALAAIVSLLGTRPLLQEHSLGAKLLGEVGTPEILPALLDACREDLPFGRYRDEVVLALTKIASASPEKMVPFLRHRDARARHLAAEVLRRLKWEPDTDADRASLYCLSKRWSDAALLGVSNAKEPLALALSDSLSREEKQEVVRCLREIGYEPQTDTERAEFCAVAEEYDKLGQMGLAALPTAARLLKTGNVEEKLVATMALGRVEDSRSIPYLVDALAEPGPVSEAAKNALAAFGPSIAETLIVCLRRSFLAGSGDREWRIAGGAAEVLMWLGSPVSGLLLSELTLAAPPGYADTILRILAEVGDAETAAELKRRSAWGFRATIKAIERRLSAPDSSWPLKIT